MKRGKEEITDKKLMAFLIIAVMISLVSVWTVLLSVDFNVLEGRVQTQTITIKQSPPSSGGGIVGLTILPPGSELNQTNQTEDV